jgi:hypothetical protein
MSQILPCTRPYLRVKHTAPDHRVCGLKRIHCRLYSLLSEPLIVCYETIHTFTYSSHISMKNCRIPSSFLPSCNNTIFVSDIPCHCPCLCRKFTALTSRCHKRRYCPLVKFVYRLEIPLEIIYTVVLAQICIFTHIKFCFRISSSVTSRLAYAII